MTGVSKPRNGRRGGLRLALLLAGVALGLSACAARDRYMGIPLHGEASPVPEGIRTLAAAAQAGDKHAQFELGAAFEAGTEVPQDTGKARTLYRLAAADSGGPIWVYSPPVTRGGRGRVIEMNGPPRQAGLEVARLRLEALDARKKAANDGQGQQ